MGRWVGGGMGVFFVRARICSQKIIHNYIVFHNCIGKRPSVRYLTQDMEDIFDMRVHDGGSLATSCICVVIVFGWF